MVLTSTNRLWKSRMIIAVNFQCNQLERRSLKKIWASTGCEPVTSANFGGMLYQLSNEGHVWLHSAVGRASHRYSQRSRVRIPLKPRFFQASSFQFTPAVQMWNISYILFIVSLLTRRYELNKLTSLPMCCFAAQLAEQSNDTSWRPRDRILLKPWFFRLFPF